MSGAYTGGIRFGANAIVAAVAVPKGKPEVFNIKGSASPPAWNSEFGT